MDDLKTKGTRAFIWDFLGKMATHGMGFIVSIFLARLLEPSDFGLIAIVMVIISIAFIFTDVGLGGALIQKRRVLSIHYSSVFYFNIIAGMCLAFFTYISASWVSSFYETESLLPIVQVMSFLFIINALSSVQTIHLRKELNYPLLTKIGLISSLISGAIGITLAFMDMGVWSLVWQTVIYSIIYNILIWYKSIWIPDLNFSWKALMQLWGFGFRMFIVEVLNTVFTRLDFLIIGKSFSPATLGFFQRAKSLNSLISQYSSGSLMTILFPILSKVQNNLPRFQNIVIKVMGIISFATFLLIGIFYLIGGEMIVILFSEKWLPSVDIFKILVLSGFALPISSLLVNIISSRGNSKKFLQLEIYKKAIASINLLCLYFLGIEVFLYGLILQSTIGVSLNIVFASREINLPFLTFAKPIVIQAVLALFSVVITNFVCQYINYTSTIVILISKTSIFSIIYLLFNYIFKTNSFIYSLEQLRLIVSQKT